MKNLKRHLKYQHLKYQWLAGALFCAAFLTLTACSNSNADIATKPSAVELLRTPNGGIQPQALLDKSGVLHLIYYKGDASAGDIFYVHSNDYGKKWSEPLRVNSQAGSAIAMGTIRGAQLAVGKDNRVHVTWNGSGKATPKGVGGTPMLYARLNETGTAFEPQRNLITWAGGIDGGGTVAADGKGDVYVLWHAMAGAEDEAGRAVFMAFSNDNGRTFAREKKVNPQPTGACGCCGMRAFVDSKDTLYVLYRAAGDNVNRDSVLLTSRDAGKTFTSVNLHKWKIQACPMSSFSMTQNGSDVIGAWETDEQVYRGTLNTAKPTSIVAPGKGENRKHPVIAANTKGEVLLAWTEETGWSKGGVLAWQVYDKTGKPTSDKGRENVIPVWGLPTAFLRPNGQFIIIY